MYTLIIEDKDGAIADEFSFNEGTYQIGRVEGNDIILPHSNVSRQHSRLFVRNGECFIEDLGSSNGVYVDGQRIRGERNLGSGAQIRIGEYYLYLEYNSHETAGENAVLETHIVSHDENTYKIIRVGDSFHGEEFTLSERDNTLGRTDENYILLNDPSISRKHALIENNGLVYKLIDLGSSNGTQLNGKRVTSPQVLQENDHITFGNVEFVFVPNHIPYNPAIHRAKGKPGGSNTLLYGVIALVVIFALVCIALVGVFIIKKENEKETTPPPATASDVSDEDKAARLVAKGRALMDQSKWEQALKAFDRALKQDPENADAKRFKTQVNDEIASLETFNDAMDTKGKGDYAKASDLFSKVKDGTAKYKRAQKEIKELDSLMAGKSKKAGLKALSEKDYKKAHDELVESLKIQCDTEVVEGIQSAENAMKRNTRKYTFTPFRIPSKCKK